MKLFIIILILICISTQLTYAQDSNMTWQAYMTENLDFSQATTGFLLDAVPTWSRLDTFDGHVDTDATITQWKQIYLDLSQMQLPGFTQKLTADYDSLNHLIETIEDSTHAIPLMLIAMDYDHIKPWVLDSNILDTANWQYIDNPNNNESPFMSRLVFAASTPITKVYSDTISFILDPRLIFTNRDLPQDNFKIDFGDGNGYRNIEFDSIILITPNDTGNFTIKLQVISNNDTLQSQVEMEMFDIDKPDLIKVTYGLAEE